MKTLTLKEIAEALNGNLIGDPNAEITGINGIMEAQPGDITFLANPKYKEHLPLCQASAVLVGNDVEVEGVTLIQVENPRMAYGKVILLMNPPKQEIAGISDDAYIATSADIGDNCTVYPGVYISENASLGKNTVVYPGTFIGENVQIGDDCMIHANVTINQGCIIGHRALLNPGCVIGSEGFGFERDKDGDPHKKVPQVGIVVIEDDVEVGALCAIDRGSIKATVIKRGTKFDNLVHVAHNCQIGEDNLIMAQVCLAGSVKTGNNVWMAGQVGCNDHLQVAENAKFLGKTGITQNIEEAGLFAGFPARPFMDWQKGSAMFYKTDEQRKKLSALERRVNELEAKLGVEEE
ncbi:MAG: UDP-3-O-(3-hydroxymyristoyl)glucosamine N-acyltransferase [Proteobacteria bacterium]|nr:UDP-3-O-(3-hydroxymyristoyl)glucosamine N-acyltransferase [Pseudomonadota bacterium]